MRTLNAQTGRTMRTFQGLVGAIVLLGWFTAATGQVTSSNDPAGYVVWPKVIVHTTGADPLPSDGMAVDTLLKLTNTARMMTTVHCFYVNANNRCGVLTIPPTPPAPTAPICQDRDDCPFGQFCLPTWSTTDFTFDLSMNQPIAWLASRGLTVPAPGSGVVLAVPEDPFQGELKCVQICGDETGTDCSPLDAPLPLNWLKGEATIIKVDAPILNPPPGGGLATNEYHAVGFEALVAQCVVPADCPNVTPCNTGRCECTTNADCPSGLQCVGVAPGLCVEDPEGPLCLGDLPAGTPADTFCAQRYAPCPGILILDHFFDGATPPFGDAGSVVNTELTLVPCSQDLNAADLSGSISLTVHMLIYNEFEQKFSTSESVRCFNRTLLSDIANVFTAAVSGTIVGQTRMRVSPGSNGRLGFGVTGVAKELYRNTEGGPIAATAAFNLHHSGFNSGGDAVYRDLF